MVVVNRIIAAFVYLPLFSCNLILTCSFKEILIL